MGHNIDVTPADVVIVGGGMAGLTLALQLRREKNDLDIVVLERKPHPLPPSTPKVGESTVEIGAHYLADVVDLQHHLEQSQLPKFGLRLFFGDTLADFSHSDELGSSRLLAVPTYQLDRGIFENYLAQTALEKGIRFHDNATVYSLSTDRNHHIVSIRDGQVQKRLKTHWLIDAAGRNSLLKPSLGLACDNKHNCDAVWFRIGGRICIDDWSSSASWRDRCVDLNGKRWLSTNHLMGPGYWVWIIPLASGATSVGIVFDQNMHSIDSMRSFDLALKWLETFQPRCADAIRGRSILDFRFLKNYSYSCKQVFSKNRWALAGEAGVFLDPFYSPGCDSIAISNTLITDLVVREMRGENIHRRCLAYQQIYTSYYDSTLSLYQNQYPGFGDSHLMIIKTVWDYAFYWGVLSLLFFSRSLTNLDFITRSGDDLGKARRYNYKMQTAFLQRAKLALHVPPRGIFIDQSEIPVLHEFNSNLVAPLTEKSLSETLLNNVITLETVSDYLIHLLCSPSKLTTGNLEKELFGDLYERLSA